MAKRSILRYIPFMVRQGAAAKQKTGRFEVIGPRGGAFKDQYIVREASSGRFMAVRGAGSMKDAKFEIDNDIDLNKPIAEQALDTTTQEADRTKRG